MGITGGVRRLILHPSECFQIDHDQDESHVRKQFLRPHNHNHNIAELARQPLVEIEEVELHVSESTADGTQSSDYQAGSDTFV